MGYIWQGRKLCCDLCGKPGSKMMRCPFGYCPRTAACPSCRKTRKDVLCKAAHRARGCERLHNEFVAEQERELQTIRDGKPVRCSARSETDPHGGSRVHVLFRTSVSPDDYATIGFYMSLVAYDAIPLGTIATPDDYRKHGHLTPAPSDYVN